MLYKEAENNFEIKPFTKEGGVGIREHKLEKQILYKQSYLYEQYDRYCKAQGRATNIHTNMFSREIVKNKPYIIKQQLEGTVIFVIELDKWKIENNFKKVELTQEGEYILDF